MKSTRHLSLTKVCDLAPTRTSRSPVFLQDPSWWTELQAEDLRSVGITSFTVTSQSARATSSIERWLCPSKEEIFAPLWIRSTLSIRKDFNSLVVLPVIYSPSTL